MKIVYVTEFFSEKMGYSENCLPKAMALLGQEVHVIASNLQVYGNTPKYEETYGRYLGPRVQPCGTMSLDGYTLHRLPHRLQSGYVGICGLISKIGMLKPDIVQTHNCISSNALKIAIAQRILGYKLFTECHQHMSVTKPYLHDKTFSHPKRLLYFASRTFPGRFVSLFTEKCFPVASDCAEVARRFYGVRERKIRIVPLGTDTDVFQPVGNEIERQERFNLRQSLGFSESEIVCIYTGRFSQEKNPLILAQAVSTLKEQGLHYGAIFIGDGEQKSEIESCKGCIVIPFVQYIDLPMYYRASDIAIWPTQESMSMLDAASCGIPLVVSNRVGDLERVVGSGATYREGDVGALAEVLRSLYDEKLRRELGIRGREKMVEKYSWIRIAKDLLEEYKSRQVL